MKGQRYLYLVVAFLLATAPSLAYAIPTFGHDANQIRAGTFGSGSYAFPNSLSISGNLDFPNTNRIRFTVSSLRNALVLGGSNILQVGDSGEYTGIVFLPGASEAMRITSAGNIGIGTTSPGQKLVVVGTVNATAFVGDGSGLTNLPGVTGGNVSGNGAPNYIAKFSNGTTVVSSGMYETGGNIGIGTTSPERTLDVNGLLQMRGYAIHRRDESGLLEIDGGVNSTTFGANIELYGGAYPTLGGRAYYDARLHTFRNSSNSPTMFVIDPESNKSYFASGNVGIGTTAPESSLDVRRTGTASIAVQSTPGTNGNALVSLSGRSATSGGATWSLIANGDGSGYGPFGSLTFRESDNGANIMTITDGGNVGIGTTNPIKKLHVSDGNTSVNSSLVTSDYFVISAQNDAPSINIISAANQSEGYRGVFKGTRTRGTLQNPLVPQTGDDVATFLGAIYDGIDTEGTAGFFLRVDGNVSNNTAPQRIDFVTSQTNAENRTTRMTVKSDGTVGIGASTPGRMLDIRANTTFLGSNLQFGAGQQGSTPYQVAIGSRPETTYGEIQATQFGVGNNVPLAINSLGGNVGIGTTSPASKLDVQGDVTLNGNYLLNSPTVKDVSTQGLVIYWPTEEGSGTLTKDWSGNSNDGTTTATWTTGQVGNGLYFNDTTSISVPAQSAFDISGSKNFTWSLWINRDASNRWEYYIEKGGDWGGFGTHTAGNIFYSFRLADGSFGGQHNVGYTPPTGTWTHLVLVHAGTTFYTYANGVLQDTYDAGQGLYGTSGSSFGTNINQRKYVGKADEIRAYSRALTADEVKTLYQHGVNRKQEVGGSFVSRNVVYTTQDGKIGIGTTTPATKLQIDGTGAAILINSSTSAGMVDLRRDSDNAGYAYFGNINDGAQRFQVGWNGANNFADLVTNSYLYPIKIDGSSILLQTQNTNGNVGIGAANPQQKLEVAGKINITGTGNGIYFPDGSFQTSATTAGSSSGNGWVNTTGSVRLATATDKVGIGGTSSSKLYVYDDTGDYAIRAMGAGTANGQILLSGGSGRNYAIISQGSAAGTNSFVIRDASASADRLTITSAGNVGIGTSSPAQKLHVLESGLAEPVIFEQVATPGGAPDINLRKALGTPAAKTIVGSGDITGRILGFGWDGNSYERNAAIGFFVDGTPSDGVMPGRIAFNTRAGSGDIVEQMTLKSDGKLGIGMTSPETPLHINGSDGGITLQDNNSPAKFTMGAGSSDVFYLDEGASRRFMIDGGLVGIATSSPGATLDVNGKIKLSDDGTTAAAGQMRFASSTFQGYNGTQWVTLSGGSGGGATYWAQNGAKIYYNDGNVGVGTNDPGYKLHVIGTGAFTGQVDIKAGNRLSLENPDGTTSVNLKNTGTNGQTKFVIEAPFSGTERLVIDNSGNVGIGTTSPGHRLDIAGGGVNIATYNNNSNGITWGTSTTTLAKIITPSGMSNGDTALAFFTTTDDGVNLLERMRIQHDGNIGIGTTSPTSDITINDVTGNPSVTLQENGLATSGLQSAGGITYLQAGNTGGSLRLRTNGNNDRLTIDSSGNVGIGTTTPRGTASKYLTISGGGGNNDGGIAFVNEQTAGTSALGRIAFYNASTQLAEIIAGATANNASALTFSTATSGSVAERMRIDHTGNVGIGTSNPQLTGKGLDIENAGQASLRLNDTVAGAFELQSTSIFGNNALNIAVPGSGVNPMTILANGNIGVGTTSPQAKLEVNGNINITGTGNKLYFPDGSFQSTAASGTSSYVQKIGNDLIVSD